MSVYWLVISQTTTMMPAVGQQEQSSPDLSTASSSKEDEMNNKHVLRQAQLARELQQLNEMLANKQQLAGQMMRSDEQLASVKLQYEVGTTCLHHLSLKTRKCLRIIEGLYSDLWMRAVEAYCIG